MGRRVLAVDDDASVLEVVTLNLEAEGFEVDAAATVAEAVDTFDDSVHELIILDAMLPDGDGFEVARQIRQTSAVPIMMLSAKDTDVDKAVGLGVGADDYLTKPFSPIELIARVKAHLRRYDRERTLSSGGDDHATVDTLVVGGIEIDSRGRIVRVDGIKIDLTAKEFDLLHLLASHVGRAYTKEQIYAAVWGEHWGGDYSTVQVHVRRLRSKIEPDAAEPTYIQTVWGIGYRFEIPGES